MFDFGFLAYVHSSNKIFKFVIIDKIVLYGISRKHVMNIPSCLKYTFLIKFAFSKDLLYNSNLIFEIVEMFHILENIHFDLIFFFI